MEMRAQLIKQLRGDLIRLGADRLEIAQQTQSVPEGPGYQEAMQPLLARQQQVNDAYNATQKQIKTLQQRSQPTLL
jgi:hypothetical protein